MSTDPRPTTYRDTLFAGPFAGKPDPWAEAGRYFHQIHAGLIGALLEHLRTPLFDLGYFARREASLQITEQDDPDVFVRHTDPPPADSAWNYDRAATLIRAEPGIKLTASEPELDAVYIKHLETGDLVTVVEIVSPSNKTERVAVERYTSRRYQLVHERRVNIVELDLTRSIKRLLTHSSLDVFPYHIAIYLPADQPRIISIEFDTPIKRFALPLRNEVLGVDPQPLYDQAYQQASIALQLQKDNRYREEDLPFPSLLTNEQRQQFLATVTAWRTQLAILKDKA
jgi:hypothetical protein